MALPAMMYRDPAECVDEMRRIEQAMRKRVERDKLHKGRRIRALVKQAMKGKK